jgi:cysteine desulfurase
MRKRIYVDYAATTPIKKQVLDEMYPYLTADFANPSGAYSMATESRMAIDSAREKVADAINASRNEIYFTSGGSESDNWAILGTALANSGKGRHILTTKIEHHAVLHSCQYLEKLGFRVTYLDVDSKGLVDIEQLKDAISNDTILVSVMYANNEVGTIQPIKRIGEICREKGILFHTDAVQAMGNIPVDVQELNVDLMSMAAHKFYGPKGVGALYIKKGTKIDSYIHGGSQERGKRAGTYNTAGIVGMGKAIEMTCGNLSNEYERLSGLRDRLIGELLEVAGAKLNGAPGLGRLPGNCNISFEGVDGELLLAMLDTVGIYASSGSACSAGSTDPSHVLTAMGVSESMAKGSLRITIGSDISGEDIEFVISRVKENVEKIRNL